MSRTLYVHPLEPGDQLCLAHAQNVRDRIHTSLGPNAIAGGPTHADTVLLVPSFNPAYERYAQHLLDDAVVMRHFDRCFVFDTADRPADYLRGCYVSMPAKRFDDARHRAIGFLHHDDRPETAEAMETQPIRLFSFRGAASHPVRRRIVAQLGGTSEGAVTLTGKWLNYSDEEQQVFWRELGQSRFVLCPRGLGTSSVRVQETMQAGRVPVIIADGWVPPSGPEWPAFSLRVAEREVAGIPDLLRRRADDAAEMGRIARATWERYYEPASAFVPWLLTLLDELDGSAGWSAERETKRWRSLRFRWSQGFDPLHQGLDAGKAAVGRARRAARRTRSAG